MGRESNNAANVEELFNLPGGSPNLLQDPRGLQIPLITSATCFQIAIFYLKPLSFRLKLCSALSCHQSRATYIKGNVLFQVPLVVCCNPPV